MADADNSETERNWDLDMAEDVKGEVENKYGPVKRIKVDKMSRVSLASLGDCLGMPCTDWVREMCTSNLTVKHRLLELIRVLAGDSLEDDS